MTKHDSIQLVPLGTAVLTLAAEVRLPGTPSGDRVVAEMQDFEIAGERLNAKLKGRAAADWIVVGRDGIMLLDVRLTLQTHDGAVIYMQANGRANAAQMHAGAPIFMAARFETGHPEYAWLNRIVAVAKGAREENRVRYEVSEVR